MVVLQWQIATANEPIVKQWILTDHTSEIAVQIGRAMLRDITQATIGKPWKDTAELHFRRCRVRIATDEKDDFLSNRIAAVQALDSAPAATPSAPGNVPFKSDDDIPF
jgi:hypothetical protein